MANFSIDNLAYVNEHLAANNYLNGDHPGADDAKFFIALNGMPPKKQFPQIYFCYQSLMDFGCFTKKQELKKDAHKKKQQKQAGNDDINHFENDNVDAEIKVKAEQRKAKTLAQNNQQKPVVKKMVIFEFKLFETIDQAQLEQIVKKIKDNINPNGLVWGQNVDYKDIPFGAKKIVMSMIIEDDKIIIEDIFDQITSLEDDISVVDIVSPCRL